MENAPQHFVPNLDDLLTIEQAAQWLKLTPERLMAKTKGRTPQVPAFKINQRVIRFHPRTILAKLARDAGVSTETIAASFGARYDRSPSQNHV